MKKIVWNLSRKLKAQVAPASTLYDFLDDKTISDYNDLEDRVRSIDYDLLEGRELPTLTEEDVDNYVIDEVEDDESLQQNIEEEIEQQDVNQAPLEMTDEEFPEFTDVRDALDWAIDNNKVVRINYQTRKGIDVARTVEPHAIFPAKTGNLVLVTYDRSIRGIRNFIVNNISNYIFSGKEFKKRMRIMPVNKEIDIMENNIFANLRDIGDSLDKKGLKKSGEVITGVMKDLLQIKKAQYVGVQGYWLRNRRCWDNCYRQKRTTEPTKAAQAVWMECWDEYQKSINNDQSGWEKYAEGKKITKTAEQKLFIKKASQKIKDGISHGEAIYSSIDEESSKQTDSLIKNAGVLSDLAEILDKNGHKEIGKKIAETSLILLKEAQKISPFADPIEMGRPSLWTGVSKPKKPGWFSAERWTQKGKDKKLLSDVLARLRNLSQVASELTNRFSLLVQLNQQQTSQSQKPAQETGQKPAQEIGKSSLITENVEENFRDWQRKNSNPRADVRDKNNIKIAESPSQYAKRQLKSLGSFLRNVGKEQARLAEIAGGTENSDIKNMANNASQSIANFLQTSNLYNIFQNISKSPDENAGTKLMVQYGSQIATGLQNLSSGINQVMGGIQPAVVADLVDPPAAASPAESAVPAGPGDSEGAGSLPAGPGDSEGAGSLPTLTKEGIINQLSNLNPKDIILYYQVVYPMVNKLKDKYQVRSIKELMPKLEANESYGG